MELDNQVKAKVQEELITTGQKAPSELTEALADSTEDGGEAEPSGFFGKYLKKHRDIKKRAQEAVLEQEEEKR